MLSKKFTWFIGIIFIWLALAVYLPPYHNFFVGDDYVQLERASVLLHTPWRAYQMFSPYWTDWYYRPVQNLWFLVNRLTFGLTPFGFYVTLVCTHLLAIAALYGLIRQAGVKRGVALGVMVLFAINARHQDVASWLSSIAILGAAFFSLLSAATYINYLGNPGRGWRLVMAALLAFAALVTHEEGVLLPAFLLFIHFSWRYKGRLTSQKWFTRPELIVFILLFLACLAYLYFQFTRTNLNINVQDSSYSSALKPSAIAHYLALVVRNWTTLSNVSWGIGLFDNLAAMPLAEILFALALLYLLLNWFMQGSWLVRGGLFWAATHLGFIYLALYSQRPEFFAGRHLYSAWAGLLLAIGAEMNRLFARPVRMEKNKVVKKEPLLSERLVVLLRPVSERLGLILVVLMGLWLWWQIVLVNRTDAAWLASTEAEQDVEQQMKALLPAVTPQTRIFANRFIIDPTYVGAVAAVWYNEVGVKGGSLNLLKSYPEVTSNDYLFDYTDGQLSDLMPELQAHEKTVFLWRVPPMASLFRDDGTVSPLAPAGYDLQVAGPAGAKRLAIFTPANSDGLTTLTYVVTIPPNSQFTFGVWGDASFRVNIEGETIAEVVGSGRDEWQEFNLDVRAYWGRQVTIGLEIPAGEGLNGYWANPRFTIDS